MMACIQEAYPTEIYRRIISCSYPCTDVTILRKNPTKVLMYVYTTLFALLHSYMFRPSRGHPQGVLIYFMSQVNKIRVQVSISNYRVNVKQSRYRPGVAQRVPGS
jgi:hypothetical protein